MHQYLQTAFCYTYFFNSCLQYVRFFKQLSTYICFFIPLSAIHPDIQVQESFHTFCPQEQRTFLQYIWFLFLSAQIFAIHLFLFRCHTAFWHAAFSLFTSSSCQLCNYISMLAMQHFVIHLLCCISHSIFLFLLPRHTVFSNFFTHFSIFGSVPFVYTQFSSYIWLSATDLLIIIHFLPKPPQIFLAHINHILTPRNCTHILLHVFTTVYNVHVFINIVIIPRIFLHCLESV